MYARARLLAKPTAYGWHSFRFVTPVDHPEPLLRCHGCHGIVRPDDLADGSWRWRLGGRCRGFLAALTTGAAAA